jgi:hypothetical protein
VLGNSERTLRHITDFEAEVVILAEVPQDPRVVMFPYRRHRVVVFVNGDHLLCVPKTLSVLMT